MVSSTNFILYHWGDLELVGQFLSLIIPRRWMILKSTRVLPLISQFPMLTLSKGSVTILTIVLSLSTNVSSPKWSLGLPSTSLNRSYWSIWTSVLPNCTYYPGPLLRYFNIDVSIGKWCRPLVSSSISFMYCALPKTPYVGKEWFIFAKIIRCLVSIWIVGSIWKTTFSWLLLKPHRFTPFSERFFRENLLRMMPLPPCLPREEGRLINIVPEITLAGVL